MERRQRQSSSTTKINNTSWALSHMVSEIEALLPHYPRGQGLAVVVPHIGLLPSLNEMLAGQAPDLIITTLPLLAETLPLQGSLMGSVERQHLVYDAISQNKWFDEHYRWHFAEEAVRLMDELTLHGVIWPDNESTLAETLAQAYQSVISQPLLFEARVIHALWQILHDSTTHLSAAMAYLQRLQRLPEEVSLKGLLVMTSSLRYKAEEECIQRLARRLPIKQVDLKNITDPSPLRQWLTSLWLSETTPSLQKICVDLKEHYPISPLHEKVTVNACQSLEDEVRFAQSWITERVSNAEGPLLVIAQDRQSARRLQASLTSSGMSYTDTTGWVLSTTRVAAAIHVCLNLVHGEFTRQAFFELCHLPWFMSGRVGQDRQILIDRMIKQVGLFTNQSQLVRWFNSKDSERLEESTEEELLVKQRILQGIELFKEDKLSLSQWLDRLFSLLDTWLMTDSFSEDDAGQQLLTLLRELQAVKQHQEGVYRFSEWVRWLEEVFESHYFKPKTPPSGVVFTQLSQCLYLPSMGTLILGVDSEQLPYIPSRPILGDRVRQVFDLPVRDDFMREATIDLLELFDHSLEVAMTYRVEKLGVETSLAPMIDLLVNTHQAVYGVNLVNHITVKDQEVEYGSTSQPKVIVPHQRIPKTLNASAYQRMLDCPYRYFVYDVLGIKETFPKPQGLTKADFGQVVHRILKESVELQTNQQCSWTEALTTSTFQHFEPLLKEDPQWRAWYVYWQSLIQAIATWFTDREKEKWHIGGVERWYQEEHATPFGFTFTLKGNLDRWDYRDQETKEIEILDYKLKGSRQIVQKKINQGEDVQLPLYTHLMHQESTRASYVLLQDDPIKVISVKNITELGEAILNRWYDIIDNSLQGMPWPAHGDSEVCKYCDFSGICRRQYWQ